MPLHDRTRQLPLPSRRKRHNPQPSPHPNLRRRNRSHLIIPPRECVIENLKSLSVTEIALTMMVEKNGIAPAAERTEQVEDSPKDLAPAHRKHDGTTIRCSNVPKAPCQPKTRKPKLNSESCIICLEGWVVGNKVAVLDCRHAYHSECIRTWLIEHSDCPCCRKPVA
ncbi:hypothetical protein BC829DRAFT_55197 [Chytridium lagenaria]|nr:hypothetical protein BC829DRAFT_55197 [Chytridium lagenaria]